MAIQISVARNRSKLTDRREPYWQQVSRGRSIGVRISNGAEYWIARAAADGKYQMRALKDARDWDSALKAANEFFKFIDGGGKTNRDTVLELFDMYTQAVAPSPTHGTVRQTLEQELGKVKLADLRASQVKRWRQSDALLRSKNDDLRSAATINRMVAVLKAALNYGIKEQLLIDDSWNVQLSKTKEENRSRDLYLTREQRSKLIESATDDAKPFIHLLSLLPLRPGDWHTATVKEFDQKANTLFVSSKDHPRHVPLSKEARHLLLEQAKNKLPNALLFTRSNGEQWDRQGWNSAIKKAAELAGLSSETCAYTLRHSVITDLCTIGTDINTIAKISGTSIAMIEKHYGKLLKNIAIEALDKISISNPSR